MDNFTFYAPTCFVFGKDRETETGSYVKRFGGSKVLIHYGGGSVIRSGLQPVSPMTAISGIIMRAGPWKRLCLSEQF